MRTTDERKLAILGAIVEDYVATREPVGSKSLLERHELGVSAATVRNDMSVLEEEGLIAQPHTSAGRIPTDKGYREFVDRVARIKPLSAPERRAIRAVLEEADDLDDLLVRAVRLLSHLTRQAAVVQYPLRRQAQVRHVELVLLGPAVLMVVLITESGSVDQRTIALGDPRDADFYASLRARMNEVVVGREITECIAALAAVVELTSPEDRRAVEEVATSVLGLMDARREERVVMAGAANLARSAVDSPRDIGPLLDVLEEQLVLLRLLADMSAEPGTVQVRIGEEFRAAELERAALVGTGYGPDARMAILGPSRMDYVTGISAVHAVARYVSRYLQ